MRIDVTTKAVAAAGMDAVVAGLFEEEKEDREVKALDHALGGIVGRMIERGEITGKYAETALLHAPAVKGGAAAVALLGLGKRADLNVRRLIGAIVAVARFLAGKKYTRLALPALGVGRGLPLGAAIEAIAEGLERSLFHVASQKSEKKDAPGVIEEAAIAGLKDADLPAARRAVEVGRTIGAGANLARELAHLPGNQLSPAQLADRARQVAREVGLEVDVLDERRMKRLGMNAILAVGQGSSRPPRMVVLRYDGGGERNTCFGFVGKGITFDSGGISLKPAAGMDEMKMDMSGAAAVLGAMLAVARLQPKCRVVGLMGCAENLPSGTASRPGDVVTARTGKTVEIANTDAEGRLVLADTLAYAIEQGATHLLDLATLTGACVITFGREASGLMTNDARWAATVTRAADRAGERVWELPLWPEYREDIVSTIADIKNIGAERSASSIAGGMFLKEFVGDVPWVHLDIAGTAYLTKGKPYRPEGPTGVGVATMARLVL